MNPSLRRTSALRLVSKPLRSLVGTPLFGVMLLLLGMMPGSGWASAPTGTEKPLRIAFVHEHPVSAGGWSQSHDKARQGLEALFGKTISVTSLEGIIPGPDTERVLTRLARDRYDMIFATSFGHMNAVMKVAQRFPQTTFEHASGYKQARNVGTYQIRAYEGRYLAGMIAGAMTRTNQIGYIGAFQIPEVVRDINAFTLGVRAVNPKANVRLIWINTWLDPSREREAAELLIAEKADVITHHTETPAIAVAAETAGIYVIGYQFDRSAFAPKHHLLTVEHNWLPIYRQKVQSRLEGGWKSNLMWLGLADDATRLVSLSRDIPPKVLEDVESARQNIISGKLSIFTGPLRDSDGAVRVAAGQTLGDKDLSAIEWIVEGVNVGR